MASFPRNTMTASTGDKTGVYVAGFARTPFGKFGGSLKDLSLPELGARALTGALERSRFLASDVDEVAIGVNFPGGDRSIARQVQLRAGIPDHKVSYTVDQACCSSLAAVTMVSRGLRLRETSVAVAGGVENLSRVPYFIEAARFGNRLGDIVLTDQLVVSCPHSGVPRAVQASTEAAAYGIGRVEQDEWAVRSQECYAAARAQDVFSEEIVPTVAPGNRGTERVVEHDEPPRPGTTLDALSKLPLVNGSATVTAGNAPDLSTGATALVLTNGFADGERNLARLDGWSMAAGDPQHIASMPALAGQLALRKCGLDLADVQVLEINEAFAAVPLVSTLVLAGGDQEEAVRLRARTNMWGGAVAMGHPTGATAARLIMTTVNQLRRRGGGIGLVCICGGIGEAEAVVVYVDETA
jgi:acetyl-CoA C-acetyltransferase